MFVKLNEKNEIEASASFKVDETFIETNKEVVRGFDGKLYFYGEEPQKSLEQLKQEKIKELKQKANNSIIGKYPYYKQLNIIRLGPAEDLAQMSKYIDDIRIKVDSIEKQINLSSTEEQLDKININFIEE